MSMRRRDLMTSLGSAAAAWPLAARAQQAGVPVIGALYSGTPDFDSERWRAFRQGLSDAGYVDGRNVTIEYSWADNQYDRLPALAAEFVRRRVSAIVAITTPATLAAKAATTTIPIVFQLGMDPVAAGLVAGLNRPGGNLTGVTNITPSLVTKRLQLLRELLPAIISIGVLVNPASRELTETQSRELQAAAQILGLELRFVSASAADELDGAFATFVRERVGAVLLTDEPFFLSRAEQIITAAARHALPAMYSYREFAVAGGLMSYASKLQETYRQAGVYAGRILKGEKPADLPILQPTRFELVINFKTAKTLGLDIPPTLLALADEVIE
jgi:putative tryptophan/tyrosine transport system substrate-binding protein